MSTKKLTEGESAMVAGWWQWAMTVAQGLRNRLWMADPDDLEGWAALGLIDAVTKYDPGLGGFEPYARRRVKGAIVDGYRDWYRSRRVRQAHLFSLDDMLPHMASSVDAGFDRVDDQDEAAVMVAGLGVVRGRQRQVVVMLGAGLTVREIAGELGLTESRVFQIRTDLRNRRYLAGERACAHCRQLFVSEFNYQIYCDVRCKEAARSRDRTKIRRAG